MIGLRGIFVLGSVTLHPKSFAQISSEYSEIECLRFFAIDFFIFI